MTLPLLLTRPEAHSRALAAALPGLRIMISPVMEIVPTGVPVSLAGVAGVIVTSSNGANLGPDLTGLKAYCVGERTADAVRARGGEVMLVALDAEELLARIEGPGPLLHLRGEHASGQVAKRLSSAGTETHEAVVYRQELRPLTAEARALIEGEAPLVLPLFSPRSARLVAGDVVRIGPEVRAIAMSPAVAEAWPAPSEVATVPTGGEMLRRIRAACGVESP